MMSPLRFLTSILENHAALLRLRPGSSDQEIQARAAAPHLGSQDHDVINRDAVPVMKIEIVGVHREENRGMEGTFPTSAFRCP